MLTNPESVQDQKYAKNNSDHSRNQKVKPFLSLRKSEDSAPAIGGRSFVPDREIDEKGTHQQRQQSDDCLS